MLQKSRRTKQGWNLVDDMVRRWMQQRIELTNDFAAVVTPIKSPSSHDDLSLRIRQFCQTLVDYVSAGHFEIYNELITEAREFNDGSLGIGLDLFRSIEQSTDLALEFNDQFEQLNHSHGQLAELPASLSNLGKTLNTRFELEDRLIAAVHDCHQSMVA